MYSWMTRDLILSWFRIFRHWFAGVNWCSVLPALTLWHWYWFRLFFCYSGLNIRERLSAVFGAKGDMLPIVAWCWLILTLICWVALREVQQRMVLDFLDYIYFYRVFQFLKGILERHRFYRQYSFEHCIHGWVYWGSRRRDSSYYFHDISMGWRLPGDCQTSSENECGTCSYHESGWADWCAFM